jgi:uncharacterized protein
MNEVSPSMTPASAVTAKPNRLWRIAKWTGFAVVFIVALLYGGVIAYYMHEESSLVYIPSRTMEPEQTDLDLPVEKVLLTSPDGVKLSGLIIRANDTSAPWIYFLHGNEGNVTTCQHWWSFIHNLPANLFIVDYRGYGESGGTPTERGLYVDAKAGYDYMLKNQSVPASRLFIYGHSLGTAVATDLASHVSPPGLILEGALLSIPVRGQELFPFLPIRLIAKNRFDTASKIRMISCPILLLHAVDDTVIPLHHAQDLYNLATSRKTLVLLAGDHETAIQVSAEKASAAIREFIHANSPSEAVVGRRSSKR